MKARLDEDEMREIRSRKKRSDIGGNHKQYKHEGVRVGQYDLAGRLEREYESLVDAAESNKVGATYQGIYACCKGSIRKHANKVWRWDKDASTDTLSDCI
jgi:hypothetical protein